MRIQTKGKNIAWMEREMEEVHIKNNTISNALWPSSMYNTSLASRKRKSKKYR